MLSRLPSAAKQAEIIAAARRMTDAMNLDPARSSQARAWKNNPSQDDLTTWAVFFAQKELLQAAQAMNKGYSKLPKSVLWSVIANKVGVSLHAPTARVPRRKITETGKRKRRRQALRSTSPINKRLAQEGRWQYTAPPKEQHVYATDVGNETYNVYLFGRERDAMNVFASTERQAFWTAYRVLRHELSNAENALKKLTPGEEAYAVWRKRADRVKKNPLWKALALMFDTEQKKKRATPSASRSYGANRNPRRKLARFMNPRNKCWGD